jgi:hypothetical protein
MPEMSGPTSNTFADADDDVQKYIWAGRTQRPQQSKCAHHMLSSAITNRRTNKTLEGSVRWLVCSLSTKATLSGSMSAGV